MNRTIVIGKTNAGKTLFCIRFASYLGIRELRWLMERTDGKTEEKRMTAQEAEWALSDAAKHNTRCMQSLRVQVPRGKMDRELWLTDTTGLSEGVHPEPVVREAMAQTLEALVGANLILHVVDSAALGQSLQAGHSAASSPAWQTLDDQITDLGRQHRGYVVLANKIDLPGAREGYRQLCRRFSKQHVIPISALHGTGFREVKHHVWKLA